MTNHRSCFSKCYSFCLLICLTLMHPIAFSLKTSSSELNLVSGLSSLDKKYMKAQKSLVDELARSMGQNFNGNVAHDIKILQRLLDTRKTLPGLRAAQKYAVRVGGGVNHRQGLFDAFLIKENHITASGGINAALAKARKLNPNKTLEIEVQNLEEFSQALTGKPDIIMLDNFSLGLIEQAVALNNGRCKLEASGGIREELLVKIAKTGVDYISVGAITKHCQAIDLSLLVQDHLPT